MIFSISLTGCGSNNETTQQQWTNLKQQQRQQHHAADTATAEPAAGADISGKDYS
jgi:hypothetical protein